MEIQPFTIYTHTHTPGKCTYTILICVTNILVITMAFVILASRTLSHYSHLTHTTVHTRTFTPIHTALTFALAILTVLTLTMFALTLLTLTLLICNSHRNHTVHLHSLTRDLAAAPAAACIIGCCWNGKLLDGCRIVARSGCTGAGRGTCTCIPGATPGKKANGRRIGNHIA